jgi:hypothetical protein
MKGFGRMCSQAVLRYFLVSHCDGLRRTMRTSTRVVNILTIMKIKRFLNTLQPTSLVSYNTNVVLKAITFKTTG